MPFDNVVFHKLDLYYPDNRGLQLYAEQNGLLAFRVDFFGDDGRHAKQTFARLVADVIAKMTPEQQAKESEQFFIYLLQNPRRDMEAYLTPLLDYFHMIGLLKFKKHVYNDNKQSIVRYRVIFKNKQGEFICEKKYSSLSQLSDDIGKKMTSLHYQLFKIKSPPKGKDKSL